MVPVSFSLALLILAQPLQTSATPATRLYVRTVPAGATVALDGKMLGTSEGLFIVPAGVATITVELGGHQSVTRQIEIQAQRITRLELELTKLAAAQPKVPQRPVGNEGKAANPTESASAAAAAYIANSKLPTAVGEAMAKVLRQHPDGTRWGGQVGSTVFGIALKHLPHGDIRQRVTPTLLELTHLWAVQELLRAKSLLDHYAATGLTDATTLRDAVVEAAGKLQVTGKAKGAVFQSAVQGDYAVAYVLAEEPALTARLLQPVELGVVRNAYRDRMHRQARELMKRSEWQEALLLWRHLHQRKLVSPELYLDAARCFRELGQSQDALRLLTEAIDTFEKNASPDFLEEAGDIALAIETQPGQALAERAFHMASDRLRDTVSPARAESNIPHDSALPEKTP
ncbi:MAG TPA: PEGA domain-containing protein [Terracidiphilus sp.]|jgi:tetratricopeptide (TPR) repeat protein